MFYRFYTFYADGTVVEQLRAKPVTPRKNKPYEKDCGGSEFRTFAVNVDSAIHAKKFYEKHGLLPILVTRYFFTEARDILNLSAVIRDILDPKICAKVWLCSVVVEELLSTIDDGQVHSLHYFINRAAAVAMHYADNYLHYFINRAAAVAMHNADNYNEATTEYTK